MFNNLWGLVEYSVAKFGNRLKNNLNAKLRNLDLTVEILLEVVKWMIM